VNTEIVTLTCWKGN